MAVAIASGLVLALIVPQTALRGPPIVTGALAQGNRLAFGSIIAQLGGTAALPEAGEAVEVWIDCGDEVGSVWAEASVRSVDTSSGTFMVWVTEWEDLPEEDPEYEEAYEEGPYELDSDEWRRPPEESKPSGTARPIPPYAVVFDAEKHASYDYDAEAAAVDQVVAAVAQLQKPAGMDNDDKGRWPAVAGAVEALYRTMAATPAPPVAEDPRLVGDWECVGCTSPELAARRGLTGLGSAPFTKLAGLFFSFGPSGDVIAKEVLEFFGNPVLMNELRGEASFSEDGSAMQEQYTAADLAGQQNSPQFNGATAVLTDCRITADGKMRIGRNKAGVLVFKKLVSGQLQEYLGATRLPATGGTYIGNPSWAGPTGSVS